MMVVPPCHIYLYEEEGMSFKVTFTLARRCWQLVGTTALRIG
jgi:hypothetical protein